jgi:hypothetical protein
VSERRLSRRVEVVLAAAVVALALLGAMAINNRATGTPPGLAAGGGAESTALYCTGFTGARGPAPADVIFANTATERRLVTMDVVTTTGVRTADQFAVPAEGTFTASSGAISGSRTYVGVSAYVQGGGVTAIVRGLRAGSSVVPCESGGSSSWSAAGLSTKVHWSATVVVLNPTSAETVVNLSVLSPSGPSQPLPDQGVVIGPHAVVALDLGTQIVNQLGVSPTVSVAPGSHGSIVATAVETWTRLGIGPPLGASLVAGWPGAGTSYWFPDVPTGGGSITTLAVSNPGATPVNVSVEVTLTPFTISPFTVAVGANAVAQLVISPNSRIPEAGAASLHVTANGPIAATAFMTVNGRQGKWFASPAASGRAQVIVDPYGAGSRGGAIVSTGASVATVTLTSFAPARSESTLVVSAPAGAAHQLAARSLVGLRGAMTVLSSSAPFAVALTDAAQPAGVRVVEGSGAR